MHRSEEMCKFTLQVVFVYSSSARRKRNQMSVSWSLSRITSSSQRQWSPSQLQVRKLDRSGYSLARTARLSSSQSFCSASAQPSIPWNSVRLNIPSPPCWCIWFFTTKRDYSFNCFLTPKVGVILNQKRISFLS